MSYSSWLKVPLAFMMEKSFSMAGPAATGKDGGRAMTTEATETAVEMATAGVTEAVTEAVTAREAMTERPSCRRAA